MSLYRNVVWFIKGMREYTRSGFESACKSFVTKDLDVSMVGRSFMITGANSGIGKAAAIAIAKKGGAVHMVCRNKERADKAREEIISASGNTEIYIHVLDLSETRKVWEFAEVFKKEHSSLDVLINNAGCMVNQREVNSDGLEKNFATNTLGVYILTKCLIPLLKKSRDPRVITVSSGGMLVQQLNTDDLQTERARFDGTMVYAQNKIVCVCVCVLFTEAAGSNDRVLGKRKSQNSFLCNAPRVGRHTSGCHGDASIPPDDARSPAYCGARIRHGRLARCVTRSHRISQWPFLPRQEAGFSPPATCLDAQLQTGSQSVHGLLGGFGKSCQTLRDRSHIFESLSNLKKLQDV